MRFSISLLTPPPQICCMWIKKPTGNQLFYTTDTPMDSLWKGRSKYCLGSSYHMITDTGKHKPQRKRKWVSYHLVCRNIKVPNTFHKYGTIEKLQSVTKLLRVTEKTKESTPLPLPSIQSWGVCCFLLVADNIAWRG